MANEKNQDQNPKAKQNIQNEQQGQGRDRSMNQKSDQGEVARQQEQRIDRSNNRTGAGETSVKSDEEQSGPTGPADL